MPTTDFLARYAELHPSKPAVIEDTTVLDHATFNVLVNRWANALAGLGVRAGDKVIWVGQNGIEVVTIVAAGRKAGPGTPQPKDWIESGVFWQVR